MKGEWDDIDCLAYDGPVRVAFDGIGGSGYIVIFNDVEIGRIAFAMNLEPFLRSIVPEVAAKKLADEAVSNLGPWT